METSTLFARVLSLRVEPTQRTHSQRAIGVSDGQVSARSSASSSAAARSAGTSGSGQSFVVVRVNSTVLPSLA